MKVLNLCKNRESIDINDLEDLVMREVIFDKDSEETDVVRSYFKYVLKVIIQDNNIGKVILDEDVHGDILKVIKDIGIEVEIVN